MTPKISILDFLHFDCPTVEQKNALLAMQEFISEKNNQDFQILCGAAGTGKTSITTALIGYLNQKEIKYRISAPTGRAARILGRKSKTENSTIHSMIYDVNSNPETGVVFFTLKLNTEDDMTVYIIDEASMIGTIAHNDELSLFKSKNSLLQDLTSYVKAGNKNNKVLFLGDRNQLPPVNEDESMALCPDYLGTTFQWKGAVHHLTEVKRQEDGSEIMRNAVALRRGIDEGTENVKLDGFYFPNGFKAVDDYTREFIQNGYDHCVSIACTHKQNAWFNGEVRKRIYGIKAAMIEVNDLMLVTSKWNRNGMNLYSGDHVLVEEILMDSVEMVAGLHFVPIRLKSKSLEGNEEIIEDYLLLESVHYPGGSLHLAEENRLRSERYAKNSVFRETGHPWDDRYVGAIRLTYGHSITCNKAQGGEWDKVYMNAFKLPNLRYQYTAVTRAKESLMRY